MHNTLWSVTLPRKIGCFLWLVLRNKVLTWDNLQKRGKYGPGICSMCFSNEETVIHLFSRCMVWKSVLDLICDQFQLTTPPCADTIAVFMDYWDATYPRHFVLYYIPHHMMWAIWKAQNHAIFYGKKKTVLGIFQ